MPLCDWLAYQMYRTARVKGKAPRNHQLSYACESSKRRRARELRARNRAKAIRRGVVRRGDGHLHLHHRNGNAFDNRSANLQVVTASHHRRIHAKALGKH